MSPDSDSQLAQGTVDFRNEERRHRNRSDRLWVNPERTVLVRVWTSGTVEVALRDEPGDIWGPPVYLEEEK